MRSISSTTYHEILRDFERGLYAEFNGNMAQDYYDEELDREILVTTRNDGYELAELTVEIIDSLGDEHELPDELWAYMRRYAERALKCADSDDLKEAEHIKQLWRTAHA